MRALIDKLFSKDPADAIRKLWEDENSRLLIQKEIGKELLNNDSIIDDLSLVQLMLITSLSHFAESEDECHDVASIIYWGFNKPDILPLITEHEGKELAYRCLISLGFYSEALHKRCQRYAAPSPSFYRAVGISSFKQIGKDNIGLHFYQWENFISEMFI